MIDSLIIPTLKMKNLRHRGIQELSQGHTADTGQCNTTLGSLNLEPTFSTFQLS